LWKGQIFHRERVSAKSDLGCKKFYKDLMVSITPQFFYGFSPTTSSPHITAITTLHESAITLLRFKSSLQLLRSAALYNYCKYSAALHVTNICISARERNICTRRNISTSLHVLLEAIYLSKPLRETVCDLFI